MLALARSRVPTDGAGATAWRVASYTPSVPVGGGLVAALQIQYGTKGEKMTSEENHEPDFRDYEVKCKRALAAVGIIHNLSDALIISSDNFGDPDCFNLGAILQQDEINWIVNEIRYVSRVAINALNE